VPRPGRLLTIDWHADWQPAHSDSIREVDEWASARRALGRSTDGRMGGGKANFVFQADDGARFTGTVDATSSTGWPTLAGRWARDCQSVPARSRCALTSNPPHAPLFSCFLA
jgi:hypothetical protein